MERLNADIRSANRALQERPVVFQPVRVHDAIHVLLGVIDHLCW